MFTFSVLTWGIVLIENFHVENDLMFIRRTVEFQIYYIIKGLHFELFKKKGKNPFFPFLFFDTHYEKFHWNQ